MILGLFCFVFFFFFFKQKTAYEMLLCDWSSDVCSSDLRGLSQNQDQDQTRLGAGAVARDPPGIPLISLNGGCQLRLPAERSFAASEAGRIQSHDDRTASGARRSGGSRGITEGDPNA